MTVGINIDPRFDRGRPLVDSFGMDKFQGVRFTSFLEVQDWVSYYKSIGKMTLAILTAESKEYIPWNADILQIGNEPDVETTYIAPDRYADLWNFYADIAPARLSLYTAGLASGGQNAVDYMNAVWPLLHRRPTAIALHLYGNDATSAASDIEMMKRDFICPVVVTEWNRPSDQIWEFQKMLYMKCQMWSSFFCYSDAMVNGFGLLDRDWNPKPEAGSLISSPYV